jgi:quinol monooxygenase YgiN
MGGGAAHPLTVRTARPTRPLPGGLPEPIERPLNEEVLDMLSVIAKLPVQEGKVDDAIATLRELMAHVAGEEGTLLYTMNRAKAAPNTLVMIERYRDKAALSAHSSSPHFKALFPKIQGLLSGEPEISVLEELHST